MKSIENITSEDGTLNTAKLIAQVCNAVLQSEGGVKPADMRMRIRLINAAEKQDKEDAIVLESADHEYIKRRIETFPFAAVNRDVMRAIDAIDNASEQ